MKYFLTEKGKAEKEVTKEAYVDAERLNGFYNTLGYPEEPATSAFGGMFHSGRTEFESIEDFNVPQDRELMGYAMHDAREGEVAKIRVVEEE